jgi:cobalt-zinc-cadmium efflux system outer membrane protein
MSCLRRWRRSAIATARSSARAACLCGTLLIMPSHVHAQPGTPSPRAAGEPPPSAPSASLGPSLADGTLALEAFVRAVLESQPSVAAARQGVRAARARSRGAGRFDDPSIEVGVAPLSIGSSEAPFGFEASLSQKLPWFGKRGLDVAQRSAEARAAEGDLALLQTELGLAAVTLYSEYFVAARALELNAAHMELTRTLREAALARVGSGRGSAREALEAEAELAQLERDAVRLAAQRDVSVARMNELLHRPPEHALPPPPRELETGSLPSDVDPSNEPRNPDIVRLEQRAAAERARAERAERDAYPDVMLSLSYSSMWDMPRHRWMVGVGFDLPLQAGRREAAVAEARAMHDQLGLEADRLRDAARARVFVASRRLEESRQLIQLFETRLLPLARGRLEAARASFAALDDTVSAVLDAERALRSVELDHQMARAEQLLRRGELEQALGRIPGIDGSRRAR